MTSSTSHDVDTESDGRPPDEIGSMDDGVRGVEVDRHAEPVARLVHPRAIRWLHWVNFPLLAVMIWSGLRIYWAEDVYAFGIGSWQWFVFFPEWVYERLDLDRHLARGMAFHFAFGWLFVLNGLAYVVYLALSREWRHIIPDRRSAREAKDVLLHDLHVRAEAPPQGRYNAAQRIAYTVVLAMAFVIVLSGFAIYKPTQLHPLPLLFGGYQGARLTHFTMTIGLVLFFVVHILQVARSGWNNFRSMVTGYLIEHPDEIDLADPTDDGACSGGGNGEPGPGDSRDESREETSA
jgi:thiosulfate reductase cytochrome b subunit